MSWRDALKSGASFRGVPFFIDESALSGGRRTVLHEYPGRDVPFVEDMGRKARSHQIDAYVIGDNYLDQKAQLLDALELGTPGTLVHPYYGSLLVAVTTLSATESRAEGGYCKLSFTAIETAPEAFAPITGRAPAGLMGDAADTALASHSTAWTAGLVTALPSVTSTGISRQARKLPSFSFDSVSGVVRSWTTAVQTYLAPVADLTETFADVKAQIDGIYRDADTLVRTPLVMTGALLTAVKAFLVLPRTPRLGISAMLSAYGFRLDPVTAPRPGGGAPIGSPWRDTDGAGVADTALTPTRLAERTNYDLTDTYLRAVTLIVTAQFAVQASVLSRDGSITDGGFTSYDDAVAVRDAIVAAIDAVLSGTEDDDAYATLTQVKANLIAFVPGENTALPHLMTVIPPISVSSVVLAYDLYGDLSLESDLVTRNRIVHPGFVPGARPIKVLARA